jgi:hypothetical protein
MEYYIISLSHTHRHEPYITLWRPDNAGYCYSKERAGVYTEIEKGYHDSGSAMPIEKDKLTPFFLPLPYEGKTLNMILNSRPIWEALGLKMTENGLAKK